MFPLESVGKSSNIIIFRPPSILYHSTGLVGVRARNSRCKIGRQTPPKCRTHGWHEQRKETIRTIQGQVQYMYVILVEQCLVSVDISIKSCISICSQCEIETFFKWILNVSNTIPKNNHCILLLMWELKLVYSMFGWGFEQVVARFIGRLIRSMICFLAP